MSSEPLEERVAALEQVVATMHGRMATVPDAVPSESSTIPTPLAATDASVTEDSCDDAGTPEWLRCAKRVVDATASTLEQVVRTGSPSPVRDAEETEEAPPVSRPVTSTGKPKNGHFGRRIPGMPW